MTRQDMIFLITQIALGTNGEGLGPNAIGVNAVINVDGIRVE